MSNLPHPPELPCAPAFFQHVWYVIGVTNCINDAINQKCCPPVVDRRVDINFVLFAAHPFCTRAPNQTYRVCIYIWVLSFNFTIEKEWNCFHPLSQVKPGFNSVSKIRSIYSMSFSNLNNFHSFLNFSWTGKFHFVGTLNAKMTGTEGAWTIVKHLPRSFALGHPFPQGCGSLIFVMNSGTAIFSYRRNWKGCKD